MSDIPFKRWETPPKVIVWDVDDTLILERDFARSGFAAVGEWLAVEHGVKGFFAEAWAAFERGVRGTIFNEALDKLRVKVVDDTIIPMLVRVYREHPPNIHMLGDAAEVMEVAHAIEIPMAVITDGPLEMQRSKANALGLSRRCAPVVFGWQQGKEFGKPHPSSYVEVQQHHDVSGDALVYIADNPHKDFVAPRELGWRTVRLRRPSSLHADAPSGDDVDCEVTSLAGILDILGVRPS